MRAIAAFTEIELLSEAIIGRSDTAPQPDILLKPLNTAAERFHSGASTIQNSDVAGYWATFKDTN